MSLTTILFLGAGQAAFLVALAPSSFFTSTP